MTQRLALYVPGLPKTQGSTRAYVAGGRAHITSDNAELRPWRDTILHAARAEMVAVDWITTDVPVAILYRFWLPRPQSAPRTLDVWPRTGLDLDKLVRAANDALTNAGVWTDDARVCRSAEEKRYCVGPHLPKIYNPDIHRPDPGLSILVMEMAMSHPVA